MTSFLPGPEASHYFDYPPDFTFGQNDGDDLIFAQGWDALYEKGLPVVNFPSGPHVGELAEYGAVLIRLDMPRNLVVQDHYLTQSDKRVEVMFENEEDAKAAMALFGGRPDFWDEPVELTDTQCAAINRAVRHLVWWSRRSGWDFGVPDDPKGKVMRAKIGNDEIRNSFKVSLAAPDRHEMTLFVWQRDRICEGLVCEVVAYPNGDLDIKRPKVFSNPKQMIAWLKAMVAEDFVLLDEDD